MDVHVRRRRQHDEEVQGDDVGDVGVHLRQPQPDDARKVLQSRVDFKYDPFGSRVQKTTDMDGDSILDSTLKFSLDGWKTGPQKSYVGLENWDTWAEWDAEGNFILAYLRGNQIDQ